MESQNPIKIVRSVVAAEELARLVEDAYDLEGPVRCRLRSAGDNDTYVLQAGQDRYILRVYFDRYWIKDPSHYRFELDWLVFLRERGLPVSYPIGRRDGELISAVEAPEGTRYWTLLSWAEGEMIYPMDKERAYAFGGGSPKFSRRRTSLRAGIAGSATTWIFSW